MVGDNKLEVSNLEGDTIMQKNKVTYGVQVKFSVFEETMVEMTWQEVQAGADKGAIVLLPVGIVEGHGPHLDLRAKELTQLLHHLYIGELVKMWLNMPVHFQLVRRL